MLDIDDFKSINDVHGHDPGDQVLVGVSWELATPGEPIRSLLARVDAAMYDAKACAKAGRPASALARR